MIASSLRGSLLAIARGIRDRSSSRVQFAPLSTFIISIVEGIVEKLAWKIRFSLGVVPIFSREAHAFAGIHPSKSNIHAYLRIQRRSKQEKIIMSPFTPFENGGEPILQSFLCLECLRVYRYHAHAHAFKSSLETTISARETRMNVFVKVFARNFRSRSTAF